MFAQAHSRSLSALLSFKTQMPFDRLPLFGRSCAAAAGREIAKLRDPEFKRKLVEATTKAGPRVARYRGAAAAVRVALRVRTVEGPHRLVAEVAAERGVHPAQAMIDLAIRERSRLFLPDAGGPTRPGQRRSEILKTARVRPRLGTPAPTSRAHGLLAPRRTCSPTGWQEARVTLPQRLRHATLVPATLWGFADRASSARAWPPTSWSSIPRPSGGDAGAGGDLPPAPSGGPALPRRRGHGGQRRNDPRDGKPTGAHPGSFSRFPSRAGLSRARDLVKVRSSRRRRVRFLAAFDRNALGLRTRRGAAALQLLQADATQHVLLLEVTRTRRAGGAPGPPPHYEKWRAAAYSLDGPSQPTRCKTVFPSDPNTGWEQEVAP